MELLENFSLKPLNTFGIDAKAKFFMQLHHVTDLQEIVNTRVYRENKKFILGGGSNILFTK
ncbi:MAG: UDP-N-acetylenolpyruvoylglucosamine reductase, partial [Bacteroidota bacterium]